MNELIINLKGVYRKASATPGLLIASVKDTVTYFFISFPISLHLVSLFMYTN